MRARSSRTKSSTCCRSTGKTRGSLLAPKSADRAALEALVGASTLVQKYILDKLSKYRDRAGRLINVVL